MANNAFNFKGLYDKIAGLLKTSDIIPYQTYEPQPEDFIAIYQNASGSPEVGGDYTVAPKKYVSVADIGTGGGGGTGVIESITVTSTGVIKLNGSLDASVDLDQAVNTIEISAESVPSGLNWQGLYDSGSAYAYNDVVYVVNPLDDTYETWWVFNVAGAGAGDGPPTDGSIENTWWAKLGTAGSQGPQGPANSVASTGFKLATPTAGVYSIVVGGAYGSSTNDTGKILLVNNPTDNTTVTVNIPAALSVNANTGFPLNSQITIVNITDVSTRPNALVKIVGATGVDLISADGSQYLRTQYSSASIVRGNYAGAANASNTYYLFGDLTNIA